MGRVLRLMKSGIDTLPASHSVLDPHTLDGLVPELTEELARTKAEFLRTRGVWHEGRDLLARLMPEYTTTLSAISLEPWTSGSLTPRERELVYIAIDTSVSHMYEAGLRMHVRNAIKAGATWAEILEVMHLVSLMGLEGYILGTTALVECRDEADFT